MKKTYFSSGMHGVFVKPEGPMGTHALRHYVRHSPTGFSWGYSGSGPADLARCILIDHLDLHTLAERESVVPGVDRRYQAFKDEVIAKLHDPWELTDGEIHEWIVNHEAERAAS